MECKFSKKSKTKNPNLEMKIGEHTMPKVTHLKQLGSIIKCDGVINGKHKIQAGWLWWKASGVT